MGGIDRKVARHLVSPDSTATVCVALSAARVCTACEYVAFSVQFQYVCTSFESVIFDGLLSLVKK